MDQWWKQHEDKLPKGYNDDELKIFKSDVEDITGCIPLLLDRCMETGEIDLSAPELLKVFNQVQQFMASIKNSSLPEDSKIESVYNPLLGPRILLTCIGTGNM